MIMAIDVKYREYKEKFQNSTYPFLKYIFSGFKNVCKQACLIENPSRVQGKTVRGLKK